MGKVQFLCHGETGEAKEISQDGNQQWIHNIQYEATLTTFSTVTNPVPTAASESSSS